MIFRNGMRPVHPGEILREDYLVPLGMSASALARALNVPSARVNDIVRERRLGLNAPGLRRAQSTPQVSTSQLVSMAVCLLHTTEYLRRRIS